jgi:succinoglycan biosynthesis transport protein ExoP
MDIKSFLKLVLRFKWLVIGIPLIAVVVTYFLVQNLPKQYSSTVQISTGLLDPSKKVVSSETVDFFKVSQQFNNIMEKLKMKKIINILSYNLILHDLEQPKNSFRVYSKQIDSLNQQQREEVVALFKKKKAEQSILTLEDNKGKYKLYDLVSSMGYDEEMFKKKLDITHADNSDFINIEFVAENPELSAYVVNTLASEFIGIYSSDVNVNQNNSIALLDSLLKKKEAVMNEKNGALSNFKRTKGVLNLDEQSATVYSQISQYEAQRAEALKVIQSNQGAIAIIKAKLNGGDSDIGGNNRADNQEIIRLKKQLESANSAWIDGGFRPSDQRKVDSLNRIITAKSAKNDDDNVLDPRNSKQSLLQQKLTLEVALQQAKSSINSINSELAVLRSRYSSMVPFDADIQNYERDADLATKDYMAALDRYNQNRTEQNIGLKLKIEQMGLPGNPEPSKRLIYVAGAGISSFLLCLSVLFGVFFLDTSITNVSQLAAATKSKVLGSLNKISNDERNIKEIWNDKTENLNFKTYRELLRSIRFEISSKMREDKSKILGITSLSNGEGKTFAAYSLAYAFAMTSNKVLLIADELPVVKSESKALVKTQSFQNFLVKKEVLVEDLITIMNKSTARNSLLEIQSVQNLQAGFEVLKRQFDIIIIDVNSLEEMNIAKEWLLFTEKNICVFESGRSIRQSDKEYVDYIKKLPGFTGWILNKNEDIARK